MPAFARDLGHGDPGTAYTALLGADAAGALLAGALLELRGGLFRMQPRTALVLAMAWAAALAGFALTRSYALALLALFAAGFFELSFSSMNQTLVQLNAPDSARGRVLGLYTMASSGLRTFSGLSVGMLGSALGVHVSLALAGGAVLVAAGLLLWRLPRGPMLGAHV
jgi:MFS family permease